MFDIGWSELLLIAAVAIIVVGPKDLPGLLRSVGQMVRKIRDISGEFKSQLNDALEADEFQKIKKEFDDIKTNNPMTDLKDSIEDQFDDVDFDDYVSDKPKAGNSNEKVKTESTYKSTGTDDAVAMSVDKDSDITPPQQSANGAVENQKI